MDCLQSSATLYRRRQPCRVCACCIPLWRAHLSAHPHLGHLLLPYTLPPSLSLSLHHEGAPTLRLIKNLSIRSTATAVMARNPFRSSPGFSLHFRLMRVIPQYLFGLNHLYLYLPARAVGNLWWAVRWETYYGARRAVFTGWFSCVMGPQRVLNCSPQDSRR